MGAQMILRPNRTWFREDMGIWLSREVWSRENLRWQPRLFGRNMRGARWCGRRYYYYKAGRELLNRIQWLQIRCEQRHSAAPSRQSEEGK